MYNNKHHQFQTQYNHKLFCHANRWGNDVLNYIADLRPKIIKFLDPNLDNVKRVCDIVPDALLIYRQWQPVQVLGDSIGEAYRIGIELGQSIASEPIVRQGLVNLVEGYNEVLGETAPASEHEKYAEFQLGFLQGLNGAVEPIAFNFGTGNMSSDLIMAYYDDVLSNYKWLGFHEYDWPTMDRLHKQGLSEGNGGMWLALRYRRIMAPIIAQLGSNWSVVVTECGMTQGVLGGQDVGFLHPQNTTNIQYPMPISPDDYWQTLQWYSSELMRDDYVAGACVFVTGGLSPWESFETIGTVTPKIKTYQKEVTNGGTMSDIFVNDVRASNDPSFDLIPRIETFEELKQHFGLDIATTYGGDRAEPGERYWKLVGFEVRTGINSFITQVKTIDGQPASDIVVFHRWPDAPTFPVPIDPPYFANGEGGFTDSSGVKGTPFNNVGGVTGPNGGVFSFWVSSDPPNGLRIGSDLATQIGFIGGTLYLVPNPIFQDTIKEGNVPPPTTGNAELRVFDNAGLFVGRTVLTNGQGSTARIALFNEGQEQSYVNLE